MHFPIVISFYTKDTFYQLEVQNLIESCEKFGIAHQIEGIPSFGSWEVNCAYKPFFIHRKLQELKQPVFWVDADGIFVQKPSLLEQFSQDFATRINEELDMDHPSRVISSTIFANYTLAADRLLRQWAQNCQQDVTRSERTEEFWDQMALRDTLYRGDHGASFASLPGAYTKIVDNLHDQTAVLDPVIEHYQASRRFKKFINNPAS